MLWHAIAIEFYCEQVFSALFQLAYDILVSSEMVSVSSPCTQDILCHFDDEVDDCVVLVARRGFHLFHSFGALVPPGEEVDDHETSIAVVADHGDQGLDGSVVKAFARLGRVEHHHAKAWLCFVPDPPQQVTVVGRNFFAEDGSAP